ncbi:hypothetical protein E3N88_10096 [Mikania micrantha]|uniref:Uncharacterized protein n=1 Tax=Mikania micrantha TaxID=192012 RepID=A0A5N6P9Q0_9ASTR|nr:hypothetical protein E3N88_10096 [Mikania micrantha]
MTGEFSMLWKIGIKAIGYSELDMAAPSPPPHVHVLEDEEPIAPVLPASPPLVAVESPNQHPLPSEGSKPDDYEEDPEEDPKEDLEEDPKQDPDEEIEQLAQEHRDANARHAELHSLVNRMDTDITLLTARVQEEEHRAEIAEGRLIELEVLVTSEFEEEEEVPAEDADSNSTIDDA